MSARRTLRTEIYRGCANTLVEELFRGVSVRMWLQAVPAEHTQREADWLARLLAVSPGAEILDVPCEGRTGNGAVNRHVA